MDGSSSQPNYRISRFPHEYLEAVCHLRNTIE
jgi:hypothetical protein